VNALAALRLTAWLVAVCACVAAIYAAAGAALERPDVLRIDAAAAASGPRPDYSADERGAARPQLDPGILAAILSDQAAIDADAAPWPTATPALSQLQTSDEASGTTLEPAETPDPEPTPSFTPRPQPTHTHTPEPDPTDTPKPEPTDTAVPEPTKTATPLPTKTPKHEPTPTATPRKCRTPELTDHHKDNSSEHSKRGRCPTPTPAPKDE
jgi:outer membrane biosynthesis protein TonB